VIAVLTSRFLDIESKFFFHWFPEKWVEDFVRPQTWQIFMLIGHAGCVGEQNKKNPGFRRMSALFVQYIQTIN